MYITLSDRPATSRRTPDGRRRRVPPIVITLGFVSLVTDVSSESVAAILPLYLTASLGLSAISYGFIDALYQGVSALVRIGGGWAADRGGHPKWVALPRLRTVGGRPLLPALQHRARGDLRRDLGRPDRQGHADRARATR